MKWRTPPDRLVSVTRTLNVALGLTPNVRLFSAAPQNISRHTRRMRHASLIRRRNTVPTLRRPPAVLAGVVHAIFSVHVVFTRQCGPLRSAVVIRPQNAAMMNRRGQLSGRHVAATAVTDLEEKAAAMATRLRSRKFCWDLHPVFRIKNLQDTGIAGFFGKNVHDFFRGVTSTEEK
jgi:hypothetical protein